MSEPKNPDNPVERILKDCGAFHQGHFVMTGGDHSPYYINAVAASCDPEALHGVAGYMAHHIAVGDTNPEFFVCPAEAANGLNEMLGYVYNHNFALEVYETRPKVKTLYASKTEGNGKIFTFKRGQAEHVKGKWGVVIDDLGTSGSSVGGVIDLVRECGGEVIEVVYMVIRGMFTAEDLGVPSLWAPLMLPLPTQPAEKCELCRQCVPIDLHLGHGREYVAKYGQPVAKWP